MSDNKRRAEPDVHNAAGAPSAPVLEQSERQTMSNEHGNGAGYPNLNQGATGSTEERRVGATATGEPSPYTEPPPAYHAAMGYPTTPYPVDGGVQPAYPPKPYPQYPVPNQPPIYHAIHTVGGAPNQQQAPPPGTTHVVVAVANGSICPFCNVGVVTRETDMCCLICLILLTIFTFPFGLVFLCCLPCAVTRRCSNCLRTM
ncbi:hypothetical protein V3C99_010866 [Haemonchus contortus]|uniref:Membrane protein BRI3 n=1 Tax=Haemonchus contortus TaxID=6289 RepID=A0A7I4Y964_HAECO|nr:Hypothetical protein CBG24571 [Haemonchus contortus]